MKAEVEASYEVICPNSHGSDGKDQVTVINRRVKMKDCKKCRCYRKFDVKKLEVDCSFKGK